MKTLAPKPGEHPLATRGRQLHHELALAYALLLCANVIIAWLTWESSWQLLFYVPIAAFFGTLTVLNWRWSW